MNILDFLINLTYIDKFSSIVKGKKMNHDNIIGAWKIISYEFQFKDGNVYLPCGKEPEGFLFYSESGYMSAVISKKGRPDIAWENFSKFQIMIKQHYLKDFLAMPASTKSVMIKYYIM